MSYRRVFLCAFEQSEQPLCREVLILGNNNEQLALKVTRECIIVNVVLATFKLFAGIVAHSGAMLSDAVHSFSDVFSAFIVIIGIKLANQKSDKEHQYGHERMECVAAIILAVILFAIGAGIGYSGVVTILSGNYGELAAPGALALTAAAVSIVVKEAMYWYTIAAARKIDSTALIAEAWHHRSDALSSVGSFVGIFGARSGFPILDPVASVVICLFIVKAAISIFTDAVEKMTDKACADPFVREVREVILAQRGVEQIDRLKTRLFGDKIYVDVDISIDSSVQLSAAHEIAQRVHDAIEAQFPKIKHCMVHMNPIDKKSTDRN